MDINLKELKNSQVELEVTLDSKDLKTYISRAEKLLGADLELKGFRKGKVPLDVMRKHFGQKAILEEAMSIAVRESFLKAIKDHKIDLAEPAKDFKVKENNENKLSYSVIVSVFPSFELGPYKKIEVARKKFGVEEKEINEAIDYIRNNKATYTASKEPAKNGDRLEIDFEIKLNNKLIENGKSENHPFILGKNTLVPGFEDNILGMKLDEEKNFNLDIAEDYHQKIIAGKQIACWVKVKVIQNVKLPVVDDDFVKTLGSFNSVKELRDSIEKGILTEKEDKERSRVRLAILEKVSSNTKIDVPATLIEKQLDKLIADLDASLHQQGFELSMYLVHLKKTQDDLRKEWRNDAEKQVKNALILREIAKNENIEVGENELQENLNVFFQRFQNLEEIKDVDIETVKDNIYENILREKTLAYLEKNASIT